MKRNNKNFVNIVIAILMFAVVIYYLFDIEDDHLFNGDFALYIVQAKSIVEGNIQQVYLDMLFMIESSTYKYYSPILYPWGYPILLSMFYSIFGLNIFVFKVVNIVCYVLFCTVLFHLYKRSEDYWVCVCSWIFICCSYIYVNLYCTIISESFYLCAVYLLFTIIRVTDTDKYMANHLLKILFLGFSFAFVFFIRTEGICILISYLLVHIIRLDSYKLKTLIGIVFAFLMLIGVSSIYLPIGFLSHTSHLDILNMSILVNNIKSFISIPCFLFHSENLGITTFFWILVFVGLVRSVDRFSYEIGYLILMLILLFIWPHMTFRYYLSILPIIILFFFTGVFYLFSLNKVLKRSSLHFFLCVIVFLFTLSETFLLSLQNKGDNCSIQSNSTLGLFEYLKLNTNESDIIACSESRAIYLYTNRISYNQFSSISETRKNVHWYVLFKNRADYLQFSENEMRAYRKYFRKVFENEDYIVYVNVKLKNYTYE